ncbi:hypothetical protein ABPG75_001909 [Micractinium tetrahymenae]
MQRPVLLPSTPPAAAQAKERQRRLRTLAAAGAALLTVLLLLAVESWQQSALLARVDIPTGREVLGLPAETALVEGSSDAARPTSGWWNLWQNRMADQEARVNAWRERQRSIVYEETNRDEAVAAGSSAGAVATADGAGDVGGTAAHAAGSDLLLQAEGDGAAQLGAAGRQQLAELGLAASADVQRQAGAAALSR